MLHVVFPSDPLSANTPDTGFADQYHALRDAGLGVGLVTIDDNAIGLRARFEPGTRVLYRGWMLQHSAYSSLHAAIVAHGGNPVTSVEAYLGCHHLPLWYPLLADVTAETHVIAESANLELELVALISGLRWERYFLKDYVKSLKLPTGSAAATPEEALGLVAAMRAYRGMIEGGICVRKYEHYVPDTERRYLVIGGNAHASSGTVPSVVQEVASRINSPFFSVDIALRTDGTPRVVEIGDGQVSDAIGWNPESFAALLRHLC